MKKIERIAWLDILKTIGLLCIILAHVSPPSWLFQLRNFDVVLLIVVSMYLYFEHPFNGTYGKYLFKRLRRLIIPTYVFLVALFMLAVCIGRGFDWNTIISTFALHDGIGYVWIVRIYLIAAAIVPIVGYVSNNNEQEKKNRFSFRREVTAAIIVIFLLLIQELLCGMGIFSLNIFTKDILAYILPLFAIAIYTSSICKNTSNKVLIFYTILWAFIFSVCLSISIIETGNIVGTQSAKYPFRIYYLSYALAVTSGLILLLRNRKISDILSSKFVVFVSSMSFWIYLWHIPIIMILQSHFGALPWITKFLIAFVGSSIISYLQLRLVGHLEKCYGRKEVFKIMKG